MSAFLFVPVIVAVTGSSRRAIKACGVLVRVTSPEVCARIGMRIWTAGALAVICPSVRLTIPVRLRVAIGTEDVTPPEALATMAEF